MIDIENVTKIYPNGTIGVENINIHIEKGEFVFLVGSSGSGKSTMIKLLLKELDPTEGTITINNVKTGQLRTVSQKKSRSRFPGFQASSQQDGL